MMEKYPFLSPSGRRGYVRSFSDYIEVEYEGEPSSLYLWSQGSGSLYRGSTGFFKSVYEPPLAEKGWSTEAPVEDRVAEVARRHGEKLKGKHVMADLSGGKDSTANLYLLTKLQEIVGFKVTAVYVHMPYLEPVENIAFAEKVASRLGVDLRIVEPDRRKLEFYLLREGLPKRGDRWCTYLKTRALREAKKEIGAEVEAKAERALEAGKRYERLSGLAKRKVYFNGGVVNLVHDLSAAEVAGIVRRAGLVHPHYLQGLPRVSCRFCPYRGLYELEVSSKHEVEDEGLVEWVMARTYRNYYSSVTPLETFLELHLWRYTPSVARLRVLEAGYVDPDSKISLSEARKMFSWIWVGKA